MSQKRFRIKTSLYYLALGVGEFLIGLAALYDPTVFNIIIKEPLSPLAGHLPTLLAMGGICFLISHRFPHANRLLTGTLSAISALPLFLLALNFSLSESHPETLIFLTLSIGTILAPFFRHRLFAEIVEEPVDLLILITSAALFLLGIRFVMEVLTGLDTVSVLAEGILFLLYGTIVIATMYTGKLTSIILRTLVLVPAFFLLQGFQNLAWPQGLLLFWLTLAVFLFFEPYLKSYIFSQDYPLDELSKEKRKYLAFASSIEILIWITSLLVVWFASYTKQVAMDKNTLFVLTAIISLATVLLFHFLSPQKLGFKVFMLGTVFYSLSAFLVVGASGGLKSPFYFIFFFITLAVAFLLPPKFIIIPATISLFSLLFFGLQTLVQEPEIETIIQTIALFSEKTLAIGVVSYLSYLLVTTSLGNNHNDGNLQASKETREVTAFEKIIEKITWLVILLLGTAIISEINPEKRFLVLFLTIVFVGATLVWYHVLPKIIPQRKINKTRLITWTTLFPIYSGIVVLATNGNDSRFVFTLLIPILVSSIVLKNYLIFIPFWIGTAALSLDWLAKLYLLGPLSFGSMIAFQTTVNFITIISVALLTFLLARDYEKHSDF